MKVFIISALLFTLTFLLFIAAVVFTPGQWLFFGGGSCVDCVLYLGYNNVY